MSQDLSKIDTVLQESFLVVCRMPGTSGMVQIPIEKIPEPLRSRIPQDLLSVKANLTEKDTLKGLTTIRAQVARDLNALGTRFSMFDSYLIPRANAEAAKQALDRAEQVYQAWVLPALDRLEASVDKKIASNPDYAAALRAAAPTRRELEIRMQFRRGIVTLGMAAGEGSAVIDPGLKSEIDSLPFQVAREIAEDVEDNWSEIVLSPEARVVQRFRSVVERVRSKAKSMSYIEPKLRTLVDVIDGVLKRLPQAGPLTGNHVVLAQGLRSLLKDPTAILGDQAIVLAPDIEDGLDSQDDIFARGKPGLGQMAIDPFSDPLRDTRIDSDASRMAAVQVPEPVPVQSSPAPQPAATPATIAPAVVELDEAASANSFEFVA